jgi:hypothetical protein
MRCLSVAVVLALTAGTSFADEAAPASPAAPATVPVVESPTDTPAALFAAVEEAWIHADGDRFAALVDTTEVRIALKPSEPPTAAVTRTAAAFLFQDQIRLVKTKEFRIVRFNPMKRGVKAIGAWNADWGGRRGQRDVEVTLIGARRGGRWLLIEVRTKD